MSRQKEPDRNNVTTRQGPALMLRLTPVEHAALLAMVIEQQRAVDALGVVSRISPSAVMRSLLKAAAQERGLWPVESTNEPKPVKAAKAQRKPKA